jgi:hypothetical protein
MEMMQSQGSASRTACRHHYRPDPNHTNTGNEMMQSQRTDSMKSASAIEYRPDPEIHFNTGNEMMQSQGKRTGQHVVGTIPP